MFQAHWAGSHVPLFFKFTYFPTHQKCTLPLMLCRITLVTPAFQREKRGTRPRDRRRRAAWLCTDHPEHVPDASPISYSPQQLLINLVRQPSHWHMRMQGTNHFYFCQLLVYIPVCTVCDASARAARRKIQGRIFCCSPAILVTCGFVRAGCILDPSRSVVAADNVRKLV